MEALRSFAAQHPSTPMTIILTDHKQLLMVPFN
ncbi:hypothetical protein CP_0389 [Chlamydia pneumoniae AR39]|nr:hypothetical protein CP_0389 [Chlamydia pneumoniae AR39]